MGYINTLSDFFKQTERGVKKSAKEFRTFVENDDSTLAGVARGVVQMGANAASVGNYALDKVAPKYEFVPKKELREITEKLEKKKEEIVNKKLTPQRVAEKKDIDEKLSKAKGFTDSVKPGLKKAADLVLHPSEITLQGVTEVVSDPLNFVPFGVGKVAANLAKGGSKVAKVGAGATAGLAENAAVNYGYTYASEKGKGATDEEAKDAATKSAIVGAPFGVVAGGVGGALSKTTKPKTQDTTPTAPTPTAPTIEPVSMIRDMQEQRGKALGKTQEQIQQSNPLEIRVEEPTQKAPEAPKKTPLDDVQNISKKEIDDGAEISLSDVQRRGEPAAAPNAPEPMPKAPEAPKVEEIKTKKKVDDDYSDLYAELRDSNLDENQVREIQALLRETDHDPKAEIKDLTPESRALIEEQKPITQENYDGAFKNPTSDKKSLKGVFEDFGFEKPTIEIFDETDGYLELRVNGTFHAFLDTENKRMELDTQANEQGSGGSSMYQAMYTFAHNNGYIINGGGLSNVNNLRKTENMISSGLRHGSLEHVEISDSQLRALGGQKLSKQDFSALPFEQKMAILNRISQREIEERFKDAKRYGFDNQSGSFTVDGAPLSYKEFLSHFAQSAADDLRGDTGDMQSAHGRGVGSATITRYALSRATEGGLHTTKLAKHGEDGLNVPRDVDPFLYQKDAPAITSAVKGMFEAKGDGGIITLMKSSDITTIYHETAHYFERTFTPEEKAHFDAIYGEYADGRARSEAFAEGFVRWVADGWYGTREQHGLFAKFARFVREVFRQIPDSAEANFKLTPQMQLFYRAMLGDEKAKAAMGEAIKRRDDSGVESKIKHIVGSNDMVAPDVLFQQAPKDPQRLQEWHKDSDPVTKNDDGSPKIFYHGTNAVFNEFKTDKTYDGVFWFTEDRQKIEKGEAGASSVGKVMEVYLKAKKIAGWDEYDKYSIDELISKGYDAVMLDDDVIIFNPTQIKSIKNRGTFDENNPNILYQKTPQRLQEWHKDSTPYTKNEDGTPKVFYHGSVASFDEFKAQDVKNGAVSGQGFYFTDNAALASRYAKKEDSSIYPVYINIKNPLFFNIQGSKTLVTDAQKAVLAKYKEYKSLSKIKELTHGGLYGEVVFNNRNSAAVLKALGFDGVVTKTEVVALEPTQIKSVHNRGTFDEGNPNILYQTGEQVKSENDKAALSDRLFVSPEALNKGVWQNWADGIYKSATALFRSQKFDDVKYVRRLRENVLLYANRGDVHLDAFTEFRMRLTSGYDKAVELGKAIGKELTELEREILTGYGKGREVLR